MSQGYVIDLPPVPAGVFSPEVSAYLQAINEAIQGIQREQMSMKVLTVGGADGTLSRKQAMAFLGIGPTKFHYVKESLTKAGYTKRVRYTLASCLAWLQQDKPISSADMSRRLDAALLTSNVSGERVSLSAPSHPFFRTGE